MMRKVERTRYYFIILILLSFAYPVARVWVDDETPWTTPVLAALFLVTAFLWAGIARWLVWKAGKPVVNRASILAGAAVAYGISMMYLPLPGSLVLGGLSRLCVMAFWFLSAYIALFVSERLFSGRKTAPSRIT